LDSDDRFDKRLIEFALDSAIESKSEIVLFGADVFTDEGFESAPWLLKYNLLNEEVFDPHSVTDSIFQVITGVPWNKMFKREFIIDNNIRFMETPRSNDVYFVLSAIGMSRTISYVKNVLVHYRKDNSKSLQGTLSETPLAFYEAYHATKCRLIESGEYELYKKSFINACIRNCVNNLLKVKKTDSKVILLLKFKEFIFDDLEIFNINEEDIVYKKDYHLLKYINEHPIMDGLVYSEKNNLSMGHYSISAELLVNILNIHNKDLTKNESKFLLQLINKFDNSANNHKVGSDSPTRSLSDVQGFDKEIVSIVVSLWKESTKESISRMKDICSNYSGDSPIPYLYLGRVFAKGLFTDADVTKALYLYDLAISKGSETAMKEYVELVYMHNLENQMGNAFSLCAKLAESGDKDMIFRLAQMHRNGKGVPLDIGMARKWMQKAIDAGHVGAKKEMELLAKEDRYEILNKEKRICSLWNEGSIDSLNESLSLCRGCFNESALASLYLARAYYSGRGVSKDLIKAADYYLVAIKLGNRQAGSEFVEMVYFNSVEEYMALAVEQCRKLAVAGDKDMMFRLAQMYRNGKGVPLNMDLAREWMYKAIDAGHVGAKNEIKKLV